MCYSYEVSLTTFILGTILTIINIFVFYDKPEYVYITLMWFFGGILMQLWETLLWKNYRCDLISKIAMINNLVQPLLIIFLIFIPGYIQKNKININYIIVVSCIYLGYILTIIKDYGCIKTNNGINLRWWSNNLGGLIYTITMILLMKLVVSDKIFTSQLILFISSIIIANLFYVCRRISKLKLWDIKSLSNIYSPDLYGTFGSIWCWVAAFSPLYNYIVFKYVIT